MKRKPKAGRGRTGQYAQRAAAALLLAIGVMAGFPSCAVVTVDVDVYKGPLSSQKKVKDLQSASIALAAKPMLLQLRYDLEYLLRWEQNWRDHWQDKLVWKGPNPHDDEMNELQTSKFFIPDFPFYSNQAREINLILAQYDSEVETLALQQEIDNAIPRDPGVGARIANIIAPLPPQQKSALTLPLTASKVQELTHGDPLSNNLLNQQVKKTNAAPDSLGDLLKGDKEIESQFQFYRKRQLKQGNSILDNADAKKAFLREYQTRIRSARQSATAGLETILLLWSSSDPDPDNQKTRRPEEEGPGGTIQNDYTQSLIRFAQKILFQVNTEAMGGGELSSGILIDIPVNVGAFLFGGPSGRSHDAYPRVLQAIGNSILVSVDEQSARTEKQNDLTKGKGQEIKSQRRVLNRLPSEILADIIADLQARDKDLQDQLGKLAKLKSDLDTATGQLNLLSSDDILKKQLDDAQKKLADLEPVKRALAMPDFLTWKQHLPSAAQKAPAEATKEIYEQLEKMRSAPAAAATQLSAAADRIAAAATQTDNASQHAKDAATQASAATTQVSAAATQADTVTKQVNAAASQASAAATQTTDAAKQATAAATASASAASQASAAASQAAVAATQASTQASQSADAAKQAATQVAQAAGAATQATAAATQAANAATLASAAATQAATQASAAATQAAQKKDASNDLGLAEVWFADSANADAATTALPEDLAVNGQIARIGKVYDDAAKAVQNSLADQNTKAAAVTKVKTAQAAVDSAIAGIGKDIASVIAQMQEKKNNTASTLKMFKTPTLLNDAGITLAMSPPEVIKALLKYFAAKAKDASAIAPPTLATAATTAAATTAANPSAKAAPAVSDYQNALEYLDGRPAPTYVEVDLNDPDVKDSKSVLDAYITQLRYEYLEEVKATGQNSNRSSQIAAALDAALKQRANMAIIFPAALYLRSSYPSSSLQKEGFGVVGWDNMLTEQMFRQLPFFDLFRDADKMHTLQELDKQYWQTINTVRVAGWGITNYVIAKDDVGNWYVKNYSSDPEPIIKAAKSLALFGYGPALGAGDLIQQGLQQQQKAAQALGQGNSPPPLTTHKEDQLTLATNDYNKATAQQLSTAVDGAGKLKDQITTALANDTALSGATMPKPVDPTAAVADATKSLGGLGTKTSKDEADADQLIRVMQAVQKAQMTLDAKFPGLYTQDAAAAVKTATDQKTAADKNLQGAKDTLAQAEKYLFDVQSIENGAAVPASTQPAAESPEVKDARAKITAANDNFIKMQQADDTAATALTKAQSDLTTAQAAAAVAQKDADGVLTPFLKSTLSQRQTTVGKYEDLVTFIGRRTAAATQPTAGK